MATTVDIAAGKSDLSAPKEEQVCGSSKYCSFCKGEMVHDETTGGKSCSQCGRYADSFY